MAALTVGNYNGKPTMSFEEGMTDRYPFSFGPAKASKVASAIARQGINDFLAKLIHVSGDQISSETKMALEQMMKINT